MTEASAGGRFDLRPLGIGELLDRAVTLYVQNIAAFTIIAAFVVLPVTILDYFAMGTAQGSFAQILAQMQHPDRHAAVPVFPAWYFAIILGTLLLTPFMYVAMASEVGQIYAGRAPDWRHAYAVSFRHWGAILGTVLASGFSYIVIVLFIGITLGFGFGMSAYAIMHAPPAGIILMILVALLAVCAVVGVMLCYLAFALAFQAIGIEEVPFGPAFVSGFSRVFNGAEIGRGALVCCVFVALQLALLIMWAIASSLLEAVTHFALLQVVAQAVLSLVQTGFLGALIAVYYFDVRVRREGLDMTADFESLQAQPQA